MIEAEIRRIPRRCCQPPRTLARRRHAAPSLEEIVLHAHEAGDGALDLRLVRHGAEIGRTRARLRKGLLELEAAVGPRWCRQLLGEAAAEWKRTRADVDMTNDQGRDP